MSEPAFLSKKFNAVNTKFEELICPKCGKPLVYKKDKKENINIWQHKELLECTLTFRNKGEIQDYINKHPENSSQVKPDESKDKEKKPRKKGVKSKPKLDEGNKDKITEDENRSEELATQETKENESKVKVQLKISKEEYLSLGGDDIDCETLLYKVNKLLNNVDVHAFDFVEADDEENNLDPGEENSISKINTKKPRLRKPFNEEEDLELRARVENGKITIEKSGDSTIESTAVEQFAAVQRPYLENTKTGKVTCLDFESNKFTIGKNRDNNLVLETEDLRNISRYHAVIRNLNGKYYIMDISSNGTVIKPKDGDKINLMRDRLYELKNEDVITFVSCSYTLYSDLGGVVWEDL